MHLPTQPVVLEIQQGRQVVQDDCASAFDDVAFQRMLTAYGGLAAQIVTPVQVDGRLEAILSLHQLGTPRRWSNVEIARRDGPPSGSARSCENPRDRSPQPLASGSGPGGDSAPRRGSDTRDA